jgi:hypothetical protein
MLLTVKYENIEMNFTRIIGKKCTRINIVSFLLYVLLEQAN